MTSSMQGWQLMQPGAHNLELLRHPIPEPGPGEVLVRVAAVSLNYRDQLIVDAAYAPGTFVPLAPCSDFAGEVVRLGTGATRFTAGARVLGSFTCDWIDGPSLGTGQALGGVGGPGVLAEYIALPERWLVAAPTSLDDVQAATLPCTALTAWNALFEQGALRPGQTVLLQGTGGVALSALQLARAAGAQVVITSSSESKLARARALGATHSVLRDGDGNWVRQVQALTGGVDHVLELAAGDLAHSIAMLKPGGRLSLIGVFEGFEARLPLVPVFQKEITVQGINIGSRSALERLVAAVDVLGIQPVIDTRYPLRDFPAALQHLRRGAFGKIVIEMTR